MANSEAAGPRDAEPAVHVAGGLRLVPFTRQSLARQEIRCRTVRREYGFIRERQATLPDCESLCVAPDLLPPHVFYTPLEEVCQIGLDKSFCVIAKRSSSYYLFRFSAEDSLYIFSPWSSLRRFAIRISCHRYFELFVMTTILINCVFLALSQPIEETEYVFLGIYTSELIIKTIAKGFIFNKYGYLRNPWNWLDFIVVVSGYITLALQAVGVAIGNLAGLRTFRVLRAFKTVSITPGLKTIVNAMLHSLGMLAEVMTLTLFCLMVFALLALQLYVGVLRHKCVRDMTSPNATSAQHLDHKTNHDMWLLDVDSQPAVCGNKSGARLCPVNYTCLPNIGDNPNFGYTNFDSYGWALLTTLQLITLDFWEDVYNKIVSTTGPASILFFMLVVFFGSFYLINLTLAVVAIAYEEEAATTLKEQDKIKKFSSGLPMKLSSTLAALRAKSKFLPPRLRRKPSSALRWCSPRDNSLTTRGPPTAPHFSGQRNAGRGMLQEEDEEQQAAEEEKDEPHPLCIDAAPDIVISTGARLPTVSRDNLLRQQHSRQSPSEVWLSPSSVSEHRGQDEIYDDDSDVREYQRRTSGIWYRLHFGECCEICYHLICSIVAVCNRLRCRLEVIVNDPLFEMVITVCILLNTAFLSAEHYGMTARTEKILRLGNLVFTGIFSLEAAVKMLALGRRYFHSNWNVFDFVVVVVSLADLSFETVGGLSVLRTFRLLRVVKLAQTWPTMRLLLTIIASTLGAVGNMTLVLAVIVYIFAIMGVQLFSDIYTAEKFAPGPVPRWNFTDFWHSLLIIFRILCGEWVQPLWDCMRAAGEKYHVCIGLFLLALTVGNFLVLNLFLAMLLNSFNSQELKQKGEKAGTDSKLLKGIRRIRKVIGRSQTAAITQTESSMPEGVRSHRRWSEPARVSHLTEGRRASDVPAPTKTESSPEGVTPLNVTREIKALLDSSQLVAVGRFFAAQEEKKEQTKTVCKKISRDKNDITREPRDCCPLFCSTRFSNCDNNIGFSAWRACRRSTLVLVDHKAFEWIVLILIYASSVVLCFEDVFLSERPQLLLVLGYFNLIFTSFFVLEVILKWLAYGLVFYFSSFWTTMDFIIVCVSVVSVVVESSGSGLYALRAIRTLRALRPLRAISRWQGMKIVVNALMSAIPSIFNVLLVCLVFWLIFSIMGVQFFGGKFYRCVDDVGKRLSVEVTPDVKKCLALNYSWVNRDINFDNVGNAYLALFQVATFEGWTEVMEYATDSTEIGHQPYTEANFPAYIYFVVFIICGSFFTLNLFIGVIIDNFNMLKKKYEGCIVEMFLTDSQRTYYTAMLKLGRKKPQRIVPRPHNRYLRLCYDVAVSRRFEMVVFILIVLNMVAMTVEHYQQPDHITHVLELLNISFTAIFGLEAILKLIGLRHYYFTFPWNIFDLSVLVTSAVGIVFEEALQKLVISPTLLRVIRLIRIGRILRLIKAAKGIRKLLFALVISLPALFNIGALLFLVMFVYAIIGMSLFGHVKPAGVITELVNFQTFANSMVLLFRLTTSAGWNDVLEALMVQPPNCDPSYKDLPNGNCGHPTIAIIYLVSYIIINFMVIINMYIAVILENLSQANKEDTGITEEDIEMFYLCWAHYDPHATQFISHNQLSDFVSSLDPPLRIVKPNSPVLVAMNLPISKGEKLHCLDVLHSLVNHVLGDVEDTEEFRVVQQQIDQRFRKTFPTRNQVEIVSTTMKRKQQDNAARVIQRTYRRHLGSKSQ